MGIQSFIKNLFTPDKEKKKPAGTTSQASAASGNRAVGKTIVKTTQSSGKSGGNTTKKETAGAKNTNNKNTGTNNKNANTNNKTRTSKAAGAKTDIRRTVAAGKTAVKLPTQEQKETAKSPIAQAWKARRETVAQQQVAKAQQRKSATAQQPKIIEKFNTRQQEKNAQQRAQQQAQKNRDTQLEILSSAANTYEAQLRALAGKYDRDPNRVTQADVDAYNTLLDRYKQTVANYDKASDANEAAKAAEEAAKKAKKTSAQQQLFAALGVGDTMQGAPEQENATTFDVDPRQQIINAQIAGQGAQAAAQQRAQQLPKTMAAIGLGGVAAAQDTVGTAMGLGQKAAWALSPGAQQDAAQQADHARQVAAWKQENRDAQKKMEKAFELTENDALGQFLVELNYNFVQQGIASVAGGAIGRAGGAALNAMGRSAAAAGSNMAGRIGSQAAQRAAAAEKLSGKALQGAARYLQKNAGIATMATLAGANNYEDAISSGANEGQAMAYAVLTGAAEAVTEKLFGGNPLLDNEAGWVNRALYKMLGDKKFLKALDSVPVETFNEGFEEVIANYLYSAAQAATGQKVELPGAEENLHSFALGAAMGGIGQATKALGSAMEQRSADRETGEQLRRMADPAELRRELIAAGREVPGSRADMHARELEMQQREASARELGRQYRENVQAQQAAQRQRTEQEDTIRRMADAVGTRVVFDETIRDAAGNESAANGYYKDGVLHISRDADKPAMIVAKHEITHYLQQAAPEEYRAFRTLAMSLQEEGSVPRMMERYARGGVTLTEEEAMDEIAANLAEQLMSDRGSIEGLIREKPSLAQRFFEALREFIRKLTGQENAQLRQAEKLWIEAYKTAGSNKKTAREGGKERYSLVGENENGVEIYETSETVKKMPYKQRMETFIDLMRNEYVGRTAKFTVNGKTYYATFDDNDLRKNVYGDKKSSERGWKAKINTGADGSIFELVENARYINSSAEQGKKTEAHKNVHNWDYFVKTVQIDGRLYNMLANVRQKPDGEYVYSIQLNEQKNKAPALPRQYQNGTAKAKNRPVRVPTDASNVTIAPRDAESKKKFSLKEDERKQAQLEIIQKNNAAEDDYHTWIRSVDDIHTLRETLNDPEWTDYDEFNPDYTKAMAEQALQDGEIEVFSSYPIKAGVFVTPSRMEAESYSGNGKVYSQTVAPEDVAWIDPTQGQFAPVEGARFSLKEETSAADLKTMRRRRSDVRSQIEKLEWLEEKQGGKLDVSDATEMQRLRKQEKALTERIDKANAMARENRPPAYQQVMERATAEAAQAQPTQARKTLRQDLLDTFSVQAGRRKELGQAIDTVAERVRKQGYVTASDGAELFRGLYNAGVVVDTTRSEHYAEARRALNGVKLHIPAEVRAELGDDWESTRRQAFRNRIILTTKDGEGIGIDVEYKEMAELFPGLFDSYNTDRTMMLDDMISTAELGRPEHISLMEQAIRAGGEDAVAQQMEFFDKYLNNALENHAKQAGFEVRVKQGEIMKAAKARAAAAEAWEKQSQRAAMAEAQNKALKVLQRLRRMRPEQNAATQKLIDEIVGDFDTMAKTLRKDKEATWRDLKAIYEEQRANDPNFLPNESWEKKFDRLNAARVGELSREEAMALYNTGVELIHMIRTKDKEIAAENARNLTDIYRTATGEINSSEGSKYEYSRTMRGKEKIKGAAHQYWNKEQLSPMNMIEKMGGWRRDGAFYSMAKQLERGEYNKQKYTIDADALLKDFTEKHADWIAKADGKGKNAIWYEVEVPAFTERGNGGADLRSGESVKIYMTPAMKVKLYLDSLSNDNLRHIEYGGATFPDKALYAAGDEAAAYARGVTVKMQPGVVKNLVKDLTPEERELADIIGRKYFNGMAKEELNRISNLLDGHDKAISKNYSPIYTNANYLGKSADPAIVDATLEGMGPLKKRVWSGKPALAVSALTAFEKHRNMAAKYVGLAIPVRNMNALLNYTEPGYIDSMRDVISRKWGKTAVQYLDDLLVEIQNKPVAETTIVDDILNGAISNYVKAVFGFNPGTVLKQAPGYFMAGARLGFDTMPKTSMLHSAWGKYRDLIAKYTPLMEWRARGYSSREMAELKNNLSWTQKNRAFRFVFGGAIQWMDLHTCAAIWPWAENYVKKNYPDLKPGSRAEINKGTDPFYKKVAEVFEDAIANSQPMYDDMHTAKILHTNRGVLRGLTMFHSAQLTQANAIRQAHGELKRAQQEKDQAGVKKGQKALLNSIMALLVSTLGFEAVGALVALAKRKDKALRDEDGEMTAESVGKYLADATAKDLLGNVVGWDTAYDLGKHVFFGDTWYGFETPGLDAIGDFIDDAAKTKKAVTEFSGGLADVTDKGDFTYYLKTAGGEVRKNVKNLAMDLSYLVGVPAKNMESYILGVMGWVNPDLAAEYNNAVGGGYSRNSVEALQGKPEEQKAAIAQAVRNRAKDASDEAVEELQRLYATAGTEILPAAVSGSITIQTGEETSEQVKLTLKQKSDYQKAYDAVVSDGLNKMIASSEYQKLSDDQKAGAVVTLYKYAAEQGKRAAVAEYAPQGWTAKAEQATKEGASVEQIAIYKAATAEIEGDKDEDGKTVTGSRNKKIYDALEGMHFSEEAKSAIYKASVDDVGEDQGYQQAKNAGVTDWQYITFRANTGVMTSDKDEDGKTISGTKKKKVLDYIDSMDVDAAAKDALYYAAGYKESTIDDAPWRGGSVKTGSTGTRKSKSKSTRKSSGGTKKAAKAAAKRKAAQQALASPVVQEYLNRYAGGVGLDSVYRYINKFGNGGRMLGDYRVGDLPRAGEVQIGRDLPRAGEEVPVRDLPTYADLVAQRKAAEESLDEKWYRKYGRR